MGYDLEAGDGGGWGEVRCDELGKGGRMSEEKREVVVFDNNDNAFIHSFF